jgi:fructose-1,6-bisphosphatase
MHNQKIVEQSHGRSSLPFQNLSLYEVKNRSCDSFSPKKGKDERKLQNEKEGPKGIIMVQYVLGWNNSVRVSTSNQHDFKQDLMKFNIWFQLQESQISSQSYKLIPSSITKILQKKPNK